MPPIKIRLGPVSTAGSSGYVEIDGNRVPGLRGVRIHAPWEGVTTLELDLIATADLDIEVEPSMTSVDVLRITDECDCTEGQPRLTDEAST